MKKYLIICSSIILMLVGVYYLYFYTSFAFPSSNDVKVLAKVSEDNFILNDENFTLKGINFNSFKPGYDNKTKMISKETYLNWFKQIKEMNVNTIRVSTIESPNFYKALREYNDKNENPLYLIQGVDAGNYEKNSTVDYFDKSLKSKLIKDVKIMVDVIHGKRIIRDDDVYPSGYYFSDVSDFTIAYLIGTEWNDKTVEYTNRTHNDDNFYDGKYIKTTDKSTPFERVMAEVLDNILSYESKKYGVQKMVSFGNTPQTDPFIYDDSIMDYFNKITTIDISHIEPTSYVKSGLFASFEAYSIYPDYYSLSKDNIDDTYYKYLKSLTDYYDMPVIISEFGYSTSRGSKTHALNSKYKDNYNEEEQGKSIVEDINTMRKAGINGFIISEWLDDWYNSTWNTIYAVDTTRNEYWHNVEVATQGFGILSFESGKNETKVILDGKNTEWNDSDILVKNEDTSLSIKYDSTYLYLLIEKDKLNLKKDVIYIPIDITPKSGSISYNNELSFDRNVDFLIKISNKDSKIMVQQRYNTLRAIYGREIYSINSYEKDNIPKKDSSIFEDINLITSTQKLVWDKDNYIVKNEVSLLNTGKLTYGNGDSNSDIYNSLSDYYSSSNYIEIRIPWYLLNFIDPSTMKIHDDYYDNYGVESYSIEDVYFGIGSKNEISLKRFSLDKWNNNVEYHERLKKSYDIIKNGLKEVN